MEHSWAATKFLVPDWGNIVDSGIGLFYRPARLHSLAGRYNNPMPKSSLSPSQGLRIWPQHKHPHPPSPQAVENCYRKGDLYLWVGGGGGRALYHLWGEGLFGCLLYRYRPARLDRPESGNIAKVLARSLQCCGSGIIEVFTELARSDTVRWLI